MRVLLRGVPARALIAVPVASLHSCFTLCARMDKAEEKQEERNRQLTRDAMPLPTPSAAQCCTEAGYGASPGEAGAHSFVMVPHATPFECYIAQPPDGQPVGGVVLVVHDIFGLRSGRHLRICDELAAAGFVAVCPDLFGDGAARAAAFDPGWHMSWLPKICYILWNFRWMVDAIKQPWEEISPKLRATLAHCVAARQHQLDTCGAVGFCWGGSVVARLLSKSEAAKLPLRITGGIGFHPSHRGWDAANVAFPLLLAPAGDDPATVKLGGKLAQPLVERFGTTSNMEFPEMRHGWMTRGPLDDEAVARDYRIGMELMISWLGEKMKWHASP